MGVLFSVLVQWATVCVFIFCYSCSRRDPPALGFGRCVLVRSVLRFLTVSDVLRRFFGGNRRPSYLRVSRGVQCRRVSFQVLLFRFNGPYFGGLHQAIYVIFPRYFR